MKRQPARLLQPACAFVAEELSRFQLVEVETLRRFRESSLRFAQTLEGLGSEAELLRQDVLELAMLIAPDPVSADVATATVARARARDVGKARGQRR
ncbi:hypothetical protein [Aquabacterium humicola]|uniref:hypothetical protein n=1 Tax=Aquabacterium humicola TaxID=3237377 RepID=UPI0025435812|nr:hypothetical protein [Rubrivivax pictus]